MGSELMPSTAAAAGNPLFRGSCDEPEDSAPKWITALRAGWDLRQGKVRDHRQHHRGDPQADEGRKRT